MKFHEDSWNLMNFSSWNFMKISKHLVNFHFNIRNFHESSWRFPIVTQSDWKCMNLPQSVLQFHCTAGVGSVIEVGTAMVLYLWLLWSFYLKYSTKGSIWGLFLISLFSVFFFFSKHVHVLKGNFLGISHDYFFYKIELTRKYWYISDKGKH